MAYVHPNKPDVFISYAHVDDEPDPAFSERPGWVTTLVRCLEQRLAKKLGRVDSYAIWRDAKLAGHVELTPDIIGRLRDAALLLLVLSPAYLASEWCRRELALFYETIRGKSAARGRIFVVEFDRLDPTRKLPELADVKGYKFWVEDPDTRNPETLGYPIVREKDEDYHKRVNDLCIELVRQLDALKQCEHPAPDSVAQMSADTRPHLFLAEVTEDLETRRDAVRRHLDQAGFRVLPDSELSRDDPEAYRDAVDADLVRSVVFVQLLSETPGRRFKGSELGYVALQHESAVAAGIVVLQWRSRQLDAGSEEIPEDHRNRLNGLTVVATDLSEFKSLVVETVKKLTAPPPPPRDQAALGDTDKLVFVNAEQTDLEAARAIVGVFEAHGIGALPPVRGATPEAIRAALTTRMLHCDGMVLVHGNNPDWPVLQWTHFRKVKAEREVPIRAIALCDLPPPDRLMKVADILHVPSAHVIDCCAGVAADKFAAFLKAL
jgi:hypothetical protein